MALATALQMVGDPGDARAGNISATVFDTAESGYLLPLEHSRNQCNAENGQYDGDNNSLRQSAQLH
jgi:hypothetical protein